MGDEGKNGARVRVRLFLPGKSGEELGPADIIEQNDELNFGIFQEEKMMR